MNYVIADIHGQYSMLMAMLEQINFNSNDQLYVLGDLTDRGPDSLSVVRYLMKQSNAHVIRGNHDQMLLNYFADLPGAEERWMRNGGQVTLDALLSISDQERKEILKWLASLPLYFLLDDFILVHAGLRMRPYNSLPDLLAQQELDDFIWIRDEFYEQKAVDQHTVIFGHTRAPRLWGEEINKIWYDPIHKDKIGIDCGAHSRDKGGRLACLRLDDMQEFYID